MADVTKKISFGFSKSKAGTVKKVIQTQPAVEYVSCFDRNEIVLKRTDTEQPVCGDTRREVVDDKARAADKPTAVVRAVAAPVDPCNTSQQTTLEQRAAEELLRDAKQFNEREQMDAPQSLVMQIAQAKNKVDSEVSTREDYEEMPVENFGLALLRGMGWDSSRGIGKKPRVVNAVKQVLRPKGVGLGAEKKKPPAVNAPTTSCGEEELKVKVGACLKITCGTHADKYGKILGFNEESGRLIVELSCGGASVSVNESSVLIVPREHYVKNSRVLNHAKYESYMRNNEIEHNSVDRKPNKRKQEER